MLAANFQRFVAVQHHVQPGLPEHHDAVAGCGLQARLGFNGLGRGRVVRRAGRLRALGCSAVALMATFGAGVDALRLRAVDFPGAFHLSA